MKHYRFSLLLVMFIGLHLMVIPVWACSPSSYRQTTLSEHIEDADLVLVGNVIGSSNMVSPYNANYVLSVESYLKGSGPEMLLITGFGSGGGDCLNAIAIGERWLFFVDGNPKTDDVVYASYLQVYDAILEANEKNIADGVAITGQNTAPDDMPFWKKINYWMYSPFFKTAVLAGIPLAVVAIVYCIGYTLKQRKTKKKNSDH